MMKIVRDVRSAETAHRKMSKNIIDDLAVGIFGDYDAFVLVSHEIDLIIGTIEILPRQLVTNGVITHLY